MGTSNKLCRLPEGLLTSDPDPTGLGPGASLARMKSEGLEEGYLPHVLQHIDVPYLW